jgi:hypothetical protein
MIQIPVDRYCSGGALTSSSEPDGRSTPPTPARTRRLRWWIAGITFVAGFVFGVLAVGLLSAGTPEFGTGAVPGAGTQQTMPPTPGGSVPVVAEARVNAACLSVINEAQDMYTVLSGLEQAITDVDMQQLDDIVRRLQPIQTRLGQDLQRCEVDTGIVTNPTEGTPPQPSTPQPSASTTR